MASEVRWLTTRELAARWRLHPSTVRRLGATGKLPCLRIGDLWRFAESDVLAFEAAQMTPSSPVAASEPSPLRALPEASDFLPPGYEPIFPELWGMDPQRSPGRRGAQTRERPALS